MLVRERAPRGKISGGSRKYRKGVDHRKGGVPLERGGCKVVPSYDFSWHINVEFFAAASFLSALVPNFST